MNNTQKPICYTCERTGIEWYQPISQDDGSTIFYCKVCWEKANQKPCERCGKKDTLRSVKEIEGEKRTFRLCQKCYEQWWKYVWDAYIQPSTP